MARTPIDKHWLVRLEIIVASQLKDPNFSVLKLAEAMSISHTQLFRKLKKELGQSPSFYIREKRLLKAKDLLEKGRTPTVKATAEAVGMRDVEHFSRLFKQRFGRLPSSWLV